MTTHKSNPAVPNRLISSHNGFTMLSFQAIAYLAIVAFAGLAIPMPAVGYALMAAATLAGVFMFTGYYTQEPNESRIFMLFGKYAGTCRDEGFRWNNPFYSFTTASLRAENFETGKMKVNDKEGNPIEIAAVVVYRVQNEATALLSVSDYQRFVRSQAESAVRVMAGRYTYNHPKENEKSLQDSQDELTQELVSLIQDRLDEAGLDVSSARISHLAYAPEIAQAMLQRQQACAIIAARELIVDGAVDIVHTALEKLEKKGNVKLDDPQKAQLVSNLLVVLCSDRSVQPVLATNA